MSSFAGRVAVVTGAASGIGLATAQSFAEAGAQVALLDSNEEALRIAAQQIGEANGACEYFVCDVGIEAGVIQTANGLKARFPTIDHLVNNAGIVQVIGIEECTVADWDRVMDVNVRSVFLMVKYLLPALKHSPHATIVNLGSVSSLVAQMDTPAYVASKGAVYMLSKALALDLAQYGVRVNCVCPGITDTPMLRLHASSTPDPEATLRERCDRVPLGRMISAREIANAILYLSGEESSGITGTALVVDAGYTATAEWKHGH